MTRRNRPAKSLLFSLTSIEVNLASEARTTFGLLARLLFLESGSGYRLLGPFNIDDQIIRNLFPQNKDPILVGDDRLGIRISIAIGVPIVCSPWKPIESNRDQVLLQKMLKEPLISLIYELLWDKDLPKVRLLEPLIEHLDYLSLGVILI